MPYLYRSHSVDTIKADEHAAELPAAKFKNAVFGDGGDDSGERLAVDVQYDALFLFKAKREKVLKAIHNLEFTTVRQPVSREARAFYSVEMSEANREEVTRLLLEWKQGSQAAVDALTPLVYSELRRLALHYLRDERAAATMQPTALVHEAYLRLVSQSQPDWESRSHFYGVAAHLMRQILVDHARKHKSAKRGSGLPKVALDEALGFGEERAPAMIALDDALNELAKLSPRQSKVIELRFFGGFSVEETAQALGISTATVGREQRVAEAWLHREMSHTRKA